LLSAELNAKKTNSHINTKNRMKISSHQQQHKSIFEKGHSSESVKRKE